MTQDREQDDGRGQLKPLLPEPPLPPELRDRVMRSFGKRRSPLVRPILWRRGGNLAAGIILFALGVVVGRRWSSGEGVVGARPRFALLLYDGASTDTTSNDVAEHQTWARRLASEGKLIDGEKLNANVIDLAHARSSPIAPLRGFFIITAPSTEAAAEIARTLPHFRRGGRVIVRPIDPT